MSPDQTEKSISRLVDTHAHLASEKFDLDRAEVITRARQAGVNRLITIATTAYDSATCVELARINPGVFSSVGIHPNDAGTALPDDWSQIEALATRPKVVAIGETGLDRYWDRVPFDLQREFFSRHLDLAERLDLPVVIHSRDCQADVISMLRSRGRKIRGVQHSFTGTLEEAETLIELGLFISFAGMITFENKSLDPLREVIRRLPLDRILVETDSPYLGPHPFRGKRNEPERVTHVANTIAQLQGSSLAEVAQATTQNAEALFRLR